VDVCEARLWVRASDGLHQTGAALLRARQARTECRTTADYLVEPQEAVVGSLEPENIDGRCVVGPSGMGAAYGTGRTGAGRLMRDRAGTSVTLAPERLHGQRKEIRQPECALTLCYEGPAADDGQMGRHPVVRPQRSQCPVRPPRARARRVPRRLAQAWSTFLSLWTIPVTKAEDEREVDAPR
jgi:hypothetical protein